MDQNYCKHARSQIPSEIGMIGLAIPMTAPAPWEIVHESSVSSLPCYSSESTSERGFLNQLHSTFLYDDSSESESESENEDTPTTSHKLSSECAASDAQPSSPLRSRPHTLGSRGVHPRASILNRQGQQMRAFAQFQESYDGRKNTMEDRHIQVAAQVAMLPVEILPTDTGTATAVGMVGVKSRRRGEYFHDVQPLANGAFARSAAPITATVRQVNIKKRRRPVPQQTSSMECRLCKPLPALPALPQDEAMSSRHEIAYERVASSDPERCSHFEEGKPWPMWPRVEESDESLPVSSSKQPNDSESKPGPISLWALQPSPSKPTAYKVQRLVLSLLNWRLLAMPTTIASTMRPPPRGSPRRAATVAQPSAPPRRPSWEPQDKVRQPIVAPDLSTEFLFSYQQPQGPRRVHTVHAPPRRGPAIERPTTTKGSLKRFVSLSKYRDRFRECKDEQNYDLGSKKLGRQQQSAAVQGLYQSQGSQDQSAPRQFHGAQIVKTPSDAFQRLPSPYNSESTATAYMWTSAPGSPRVEQNRSVDKPLPALPPEAHLEPPRKRVNEIVPAKIGTDHGGHSQPVPVDLLDGQDSAIQSVLQPAEARQKKELAAATPEITVDIA
ncbi:hypothetical protein BDZ45DRAFT_694316 [Acephala macrosclerotiorum]|nr:hypothetical protein BDZ45DRAFT_694316 [Acephala macrosclerotiorum]